MAASVCPTIVSVRLYYSGKRATTCDVPEEGAVVEVYRWVTNERCDACIGRTVAIGGGGGGRIRSCGLCVGCKCGSMVYAVEEKRVRVSSGRRRCREVKWQWSENGVL